LAKPRALPCLRQLVPLGGTPAMWLFTRRALLAAFSLFSPVHEVNAVTELGWLPDRAMIDKIEAMLIMPDGALPLSSYRRRYGGAIEEGRRIIWGVFLLATMAPDDGEITILDHRPESLVEDGGCLIVTLKFEVVSDRVLWIQCNGQA
jgi:hypothetical protein